jgi:hypothetical protein
MQNFQHYSSGTALTILAAMGSREAAWQGNSKEQINIETFRYTYHLKNHSPLPTVGYSPHFLQKKDEISA